MDEIFNHDTHSKLLLDYWYIYSQLLASWWLSTIRCCDSSRPRVTRLVSCIYIQDQCLKGYLCLYPIWMPPLFIYFIQWFRILEYFTCYFFTDKNTVWNKIYLKYLIFVEFSNTLSTLWRSLIKIILICFILSINSMWSKSIHSIPQVHDIAVQLCKMLLIWWQSFVLTKDALEAKSSVNTKCFLCTGNPELCFFQCSDNVALYILWQWKRRLHWAE